MLHLKTRTDGVRYLENFADETDSQYNGICYSGQAITFDGVNDYISIVIPVDGITLVYFDNILKQHVQETVTPSTTYDFYPPNTVNNITIWDKEVTEEDLLYMDENPEWISLDPRPGYNTITLIPPYTSLLAPEYCLAWYPMCENVDSGAVLYNHVPGAGNDITLTNYTEARRNFESNINIGLQTLVYTQDSIGRITGYAPSYSIGYNINTEYVDSTWLIDPERDWMMEEGVDYTHYVYIYNKTDKTLTKYEDGILIDTKDFSVSSSITTTIDTFTNDIIDENGYFITDIVYEESDTYKLDDTTLDTDIVNATTRQIFRLYNKIPENVADKVAKMYEYFSANYLDLISVQSIWKLDNFIILTNNNGNVLNYEISTENQILDSITPDSDYSIKR